MKTARDPIFHTFRWTWCVGLADCGYASIRFAHEHVTSLGWKQTIMATSTTSTTTATSEPLFVCVARPRSYGATQRPSAHRSYYHTVFRESGQTKN